MLDAEEEVAVVSMEVLDCEVRTGTVLFGGGAVMAAACSLCYMSCVCFGILTLSLASLYCQSSFVAGNLFTTKCERSWRDG